MFLSTLLLTISLFVIVVFVANVKRRSRRPLCFPPGPKGLPFLGNVLEIGSSEPWLTFTQWASLYGLCCGIPENYIGYIQIMFR